MNTSKIEAQQKQDTEVGIRWDHLQRDASERAVRTLMGVFAVYNLTRMKTVSPA